MNNAFRWSRFTPFAAILGALLTTLLPLQASAGIDDVWIYRVSTLPGQIFQTWTKAEEAMRAKPIDPIQPAYTNYSKLKFRKETQASEFQIERTYIVPAVAATVQSWVYWTDNVNQTSGSAEEAERAWVDAHFGRPCAVSVWPVTDWLPSRTPVPPADTMGYLTVGWSQDWRATFRPRQSDGSCSTSSVTTGLPVYKSQPNSCPNPFHYASSWEDRVLFREPNENDPIVLIAYGCHSATTATITAVNLQYCSETVGNPCSPATGAKHETETDYRAPELSFTRSYTSRQASPASAGLGAGWTHNYSGRLITNIGSTQPLAALRPSGS